MHGDNGRPLSHPIHVARFRRGHVGAVPVAPRAVGGEDAVDSLAFGALFVLFGLCEEGSKDKGRGVGGMCVRSESLS